MGVSLSLEVALAQTKYVKIIVKQYKWEVAFPRKSLQQEPNMSKSL